MPTERNHGKLMKDFYNSDESFLKSFIKELDIIRKESFMNQELRKTHRYEVACHYQKCPNHFHIQCGNLVGHIKCASNKKECDEYRMLKKYLNISQYGKEMPVELKLMLKSRQKKFEHFKKHIHNCTRSEYKWKAGDMCLAGSDCYQKEFVLCLAASNSEFSWFKKISHKNFELKRVECPCGGQHTYQCGKDYCSINKRGMKF